MVSTEPLLPHPHGLLSIVIDLTLLSCPSPCYPPPPLSGCCFFFGGLRYPTQEFNAVANQATSSLLFLSCIGITLPTAANMLWRDDGGSNGDGDEFILLISRSTAVVLLGM